MSWGACSADCARRPGCNCPDYLALPAEERRRLEGRPKRRLVGVWFTGHRFVLLPERAVWGVLRPVYLRSRSMLRFPQVSR